MEGHPDVIEALKEILTNELTAVNQYFLHARMCRNWGYNKIGDRIYAESIDEMKHAKQLIDRILFLEGTPNVQTLHPLKIGKTVKEQLESDLVLESRALPDLKQAIEICNKTGDHGTRELLEHILVSEEEHIDWIESQLGVIQEVGIENYLSQQIVTGA